MSLPLSAPIETIHTDYLPLPDDGESQYAYLHTDLTLSAGGTAIPPELLNATLEVIRSRPNPAFSYEGDYFTFAYEHCTVGDYSIHGEWAGFSLYADEVPPGLEGFMPRPVLALKNAEGNWTVGLRFSPQFLELMLEAPSELVNQGTKQMRARSAYENMFF